MRNGELQKKYHLLQENLRSLGGVAVAYSSGVDSTFLLKVAREVLDSQVLAVTVQAPWFPARESAEAAEFCRREGIRQLALNFTIDSVPGFDENPKNRCYLCKRKLFGEIIKIAVSEGFPAVAEGSNVDDLGDYRPGLQAIAELGVRSPLREAGLAKAEIRELSRELGLPTWEKPSYACLASRFVYGETITREKLAMVEEAEEYLRSLGFKQLRVRIHDSLARIELLPEEIARLAEPAMREKIAAEFHRLGFDFVSLDLEGYRVGSMNRKLVCDI